MTMSNQQYVIRSCQMAKLSLCKPFRGNPGILIHDYSTGFGKVVADAATWKEAREQLSKWLVTRANK